MKMTYKNRNVCFLCYNAFVEYADCGAIHLSRNDRSKQIKVLRLWRKNRVLQLSSCKGNAHMLPHPAQERHKLRRTWHYKLESIIASSVNLLDLSIACCSCSRHVVCILLRWPPYVLILRPCDNFQLIGYNLQPKAFQPVLDALDA